MFSMAGRKIVPDIGPRYYWIDGSPYYFDYWSNGEPSFADYCVAIVVGLDSHWVVIDCKVKGGYICKKSKGKNIKSLE